jgi:hypothetical protein
MIALKLTGLVEQSLIKIDPKSEDAIIVTTVNGLIDEKSLSQYDTRLSDIYSNDSWDSVTFKQRTGSFTLNISTATGDKVVSVEDCKIKEIKFKRGKEGDTPVSLKLSYLKCEEQEVIKNLVCSTAYNMIIEKQEEKEQTTSEE